jgi:hypothetical protein
LNGFSEHGCFLPIRRFHEWIKVDKAFPLLRIAHSVELIATRIKDNPKAMDAVTGRFTAHGAL